ncbi:hypothetical protein C0Q70_14935 [Pomacea canaliculata]|uniref:Fucolectin tachylectin-4 pentraxin-1 domain-containing protein n=1 Tax=Pomacea canaliculata TaxID=400727 RepID=A0A2T7NTG3_POMCA|nr:hypothetical protein C0Q70_14935 [Pomacea canaliculata]
MSSFFMRPAIKEVSGPACLAVNGNTNTTFRPLSQFPDSPNCIHTGDDRDPYWEVDLVLQRSDGVRVTVDGQLVHVFKSPVSNPSNVVFGVPVTGETVRLSKTDRKTKHYYLTVCEVEVWGMSCACSDYGSCDFSNQDLKVTSPQKGNVALGKPAKMSSMFTDAPHNEVTGPACLAVNGNRNTTFRPINQFPDSPNCIHTETDDHEPYWEVDLAQPYTIASITVYWRDRYIDRSYGVNVSVDGQICHTFQHPVANPSTITCGTSLTGRTVRLSKVDPSIEHSYFLTVCEVEVIACGPGFFGTDCQGVCPQVCEKNQTCSPVDGTCPQAIATVSPPTLDVTSLTPKVTSLAPSTLDVTSSTPGVRSLAPLTPDVTSSTPGVRSLALSTLDVIRSTPGVICLAPLTPDVTRMAVIIAGSFLCGCVVTGLCAALVLCFRNPGACRRLTRVQATQSGRHVSPQSGDVSMAEVRELTQASPPGAAQSSRSAEGAEGGERLPDYDGESRDYFNARMSQSLEVLVPKKKKNIYKPFPIRWSQHKGVTVPKANSSDDEEYEEMI